MSSAEPASLYGYTPNTTICVLFVGLFAVSTLIHGCEAVAWKLWWLLPLACLSSLLEVFGWVARFYSSLAPADLNAYIVQMCATIVAPTPLIASNFMILSILIKHLGAHYSRLSPKLYSIVFTSADVLALIIQAFGGATASHAVKNGSDPDRGGHIMLVGIVIQMIAITGYVALASEFFFRFLTKKPLRHYITPWPSNDYARERRDLAPKIRAMIFALGLSAVVLFIRTVYRTIELVNGFEGPIIRTQILFNVLDGAMVCIATYTLNFLHPGYLLAEVIQEQNEQKLSAKKNKRGGHGLRGSNVRESLVPLKDDDIWVDAEERSSFETEKFIRHA